MLIERYPQPPAPVHEQIVAQIIFAVAAGGLVPGTLIPSVRDLAQQVLAHPNTVARAYQELERRGVVAAKRGVGMEVTAEAPKVCKEQRQEMVRGRIRDALRDAVAGGLQADAIRRLVEDELHRVNGAKR